MTKDNSDVCPDHFMLSVLHAIRFLVVIIRSSLMSSHPSLSLSNSSAAFSNKSEDSALSAQLLSKLSAVTASLASKASSMVIPQQTVSAQ